MTGLETAIIDLLYWAGFIFIGVFGISFVWKAIMFLRVCSMMKAKRRK